MEIKKILRQQAFSLVVIFCIGLFFFGTVIAREKTQYNMDMTDYERVEIVRLGDRVVIRVGDREQVIRTDYAENLQKRLREALGESFIFDFRQIFSEK